MLEQVFSIIDEIIEDGELTTKEINQLIHWINGHPQYRIEWPVNRIFVALKTALADKRLSPSEFHQLSTLLVSIQREKARRDLAEQTEQESQKIETIKQGLANFNSSEPTIATFGASCKVQSHSDAETWYDVDLIHPSCNCPDFLKHRRQLPQSHISRCCKHVFELYAHLRPEEGWPVWLDSFLEQAWVPRPDSEWEIFESDDLTVLYSSAGPTGWADVHAPDPRGAYKRFGFNSLENRWAYGKEPTNAKAITRRIQ